MAELVVAELNTTEHVLDPIVCGLPLRIKTAHAVLESAAESGAATVTNLEADTEDQDRVLPFEVTPSRNTLTGPTDPGRMRSLAMPQGTAKCSVSVQFAA